MDDLTAERWLPVVGYVGLYEVSDFARVRSLKRRTRQGMRGGRILRTPVASTGYPVVTLWFNGIGHTKAVHSLVAAAFIGPRPPETEVRHLDGDSANPRLVNLTYGTHSENELDKRAHGTSRKPNERCRNGHEYLGEQRPCKICRRISDRMSKRRRRARARQKANAEEAAK